MVDLNRDPSNESYLDKRTFFERRGVAQGSTAFAPRDNLKQHQLRRRELEQELSARRHRGEDVSERERKQVATGTSSWKTTTTISERTTTMTANRVQQTQSTSGYSQKDVERLDSTVGYLHKQLRERDEACAALKVKIQGHEEFLKALEAEHADEDNSVACLRTQLQHRDETCATLKVKIQGHEEFLKALEAEHADELAEVKQQLREREEELFALRGCPRQEVRLKGAEKREKSVDTSEAFIKQQAKEIAKLRDKMQQQEAEVVKMRGHLDGHGGAHWQVKSLQDEKEKQLNDAERFITRLAKGVDDMALMQTYDMQSLELIAAGSYGFMATCCPRRSTTPFAIKLQSSSRAGQAMREWAHATACSHPNIVGCTDVTLHHDANRMIRERIEAAFASGTLNGKEPQMLPSRYFCLTMEHMNAGSTQSLSDKGLVTPKSTGAIVRQVAGALAYLHKLHRTHNDVKPANILLCTSTGCHDLIPKLSDFGCAEHSVQRAKDSLMLGQSLFCLGLNRSFERRSPPCSDVRVALKEFLRAGSGDLWRALADVMDGLCSGSLEVAQVGSVKMLKGLAVRLPEP